MPKVSKEKTKSPLDDFRDVFKEMEKPEEITPKMVLKISTLNSDQLGDMISRYSAWREFVEDKLIAASAMATQLRDKHKQAYNIAYMESEGRTVNDRKIVAESNNEVVKLDKLASDAETYRDLFSGKLDSLSNAISTLSRELTRRGIINGGD